MRSTVIHPSLVVDCDPDLSDADVGPAKSQRFTPLGRKRYLTQTRALVIVLAVVWAGLLLDPRIGPLVLLLAGAIGVTLVIIAAAMGLGILGFGFAAAGGWVAHQIRRASQWHDEW
jgi:hypothetical protein